eukprot:Amastigsp_a842580_21.p2 type:complete len:180 gc:universal Amastigsp_a842580_21:828-289(-)
MHNPARVHVRDGIQQLRHDSACSALIERLLIQKMRRECGPRRQLEHQIKKAVRLVRLAEGDHVRMRERLQHPYLVMKRPRPFLRPQEPRLVDDFDRDLLAARLVHGEQHRCELACAQLGTELIVRSDQRVALELSAQPKDKQKRLRTRIRRRLKLNSCPVTQKCRFGLAQFHPVQEGSV